MAVDFCIAAKIEYIYLDYESRQEILDEYKTFYNQNTVPIILSNNVASGHTMKVGGYKDLLDLLKDKECPQKIAKK